MYLCRYDELGGQSYFGVISWSLSVVGGGNGEGGRDGGGGGGCPSESPFTWEPDSRNIGKFNHILLFISDASLVSEARDDFLEEALDPRWTCKKDEMRTGHPPPGLDDCVISSISHSSFSFLRLVVRTENFNENQKTRFMEEFSQNHGDLSISVTYLGIHHWLENYNMHF
mgnify:CR=1 FL=1